MSTGQISKYRPDIDGLRALAVLGVVLCHAGVPGFDGGYAGVDVFFVISGYLITKIIAADVERKTFSILDFYDRRLRRILPALVVVYLASALGALAVLYPKDLVDFGKSLAASAGFVSNLYFDATSGYFSGAAEEKALLHTWSLSVEEQFYIFWPLLLLWALTRKRGSGVAIGMGTLISVLSLGYAQHQLHADPQSAFYLLPSRAWELLLGALLPLTRHHRPVLPAGLAQGMGALGLVCILAPYTYLHASSPFPGIAALPSCLGAALVLWSGENHDTLVGRILSLKPLTFVGLISYSLYLWHWPLLALALARKGNPLALSESLLWVVLALLGAVFSWKYVEQPFRKKGRYAIATVLRVGVATLVLSGLAGGSLALLDGIPARFDAETRARLAMEDDGWDDTESVGPETLEFADFLHVNADDRGHMGVTTRTRIDVLLLGDSHAMSIESSLSDVLKQHDLVGRAFVQTACPALIGVTRYADGTEARCGPLRRWLEQVTSGSVPPSLVVLVGRWGLYTNPTGAPGESLKWQDVRLVDDIDTEPSEEGSVRVFERALPATVKALREAGHEVLLLGQVPPFGTKPNTCLETHLGGMRNWVKSKIPDDCKRSRESIDARLERSNQIIRELATQDGVYAQLATEVMCDRNDCYPALKGEALYRDDDHVSPAGGRLLLEALEQQSPGFFAGYPERRASVR